MAMTGSRVNVGLNTLKVAPVTIRSSEVMDLILSMEVKVTT